MKKKYKSELLFEKFCQLNHISYEKIKISKQEGVQTPDYKIEFSGQTVITEIKQFDPNPEEKEINRRRSQGEHIALGTKPGDRIRKAIRKANPQLKKLSNGMLPTLLVVYDNVTTFQIHTKPYCVMCAMKGLDEVQVEIPNNMSQGQPIFGETVSGREKTMRTDINTTTSAIAVMLQFDDNDIQLNIYHNHFAAQPINPVLLQSNNIRHYSLPSDSQNSLTVWEEISI